MNVHASIRLGKSFHEITSAAHPVVMSKLLAAATVVVADVSRSASPKADT
jgi:hypothetical protein